MSSLTRYPTADGQSGQSARLSASEERSDRMTVPKVVIPVTPPAEFSNTGGVHVETVGNFQAFMDAVKGKEMLKKAKAAKGGNIFTLGFMAGWELGQYLIDTGWLPLPGVPVPMVSPSETS